MLAILLGLFRLIWLFGRGHDAVALENLTLRQQLAIYKRKNKRPNPARPLVLDCTGHHLEGLATSTVGGSPRRLCAGSASGSGATGRNSRISVGSQVDRQLARRFVS